MLSAPTVVVSGSRSLERDRDAVRDAFLRLTKRMTVVAGGPLLWVHGKAKSGVDAIIDEYLRDLGERVHPMPADWDRYHRSAGAIRNQQMLNLAVATGGALMAIWDGQSPGTLDAIKQASKRQIPTYVEIVYPTPSRVPDQEVPL
jgi:hypothetical protein